MSKESKLDRIGPLGPAFTYQSDDPLRRKEREAQRMAQVLKGLASRRAPQAEILSRAVNSGDAQQSREERKQNFLQRRGAPMPAPRPNWAHEEDRASFDREWRAESRTAKAKAIARPMDEEFAGRSMRREAFKAVRQQQAQTRGIERGFDSGPSNSPRRTSFARTIDL